MHETATTPWHAETTREVASTWARLADLPVTIESASCAQSSIEPRPGFARITTEISLHGAGHLGTGEDVSYSPEDQELLPTYLPTLQLAGAHTLASFSALLDTLELYPNPPQWDDHRQYRQWALESAALDLALQQAGTTWSDAIGERLEPVRFCISMGLGSPPNVAKVTDWLQHHPQLTFKVDSSQEWTTETVEALAATGALRVVDNKGHYTGDWIDNPADANLDAAVVRAFGRSIFVEDAWDDPEVRLALGPDAALSWDAPITQVADIEALPKRPAAINIKPSRFGTLQRLLDAIAWCQSRDIALYAGGQFELGIGRTQAQAVAAAFYAASDNDIAPVAWHLASPGDEVPVEPVVVPDEVGFGWRA